MCTHVPGQIKLQTKRVLAKTTDMHVHIKDAGWYGIGCGKMKMRGRNGSTKTRFVRTSKHVSLKLSRLSMIYG
jgi:hypothetical protein